MNKSFKVFQNVYNVILNCFWVIALVLVIALGGVRLFGITPYVITSGSMIPKYPVGSVVYVKEVDIGTLNVGDDISFYFSDDIVATHRIRSIDTKSREVMTYGINNKDSLGNQINDASPVGFDYILGKVVWSLPFLGYPYLLIQKIGIKTILIAIVLIMVISQGFKLVNKRREKND